MVEILQYCPTFNEEAPHLWYMERAFDIGTVDNYDPSDIEQARQISRDLTDKIAIGVIYQNLNKLDFLSRQKHLQN